MTAFEPIAKKPKITALLADVNDAGILGISYAFKGNLYWNTIDAEGKVLEKKTLKANSLRIKPIGAIHSDAHFFHFYKNTDNQKIKVIIADKDGKSDKIIEQDLLEKKERL